MSQGIVKLNVYGRCLARRNGLGGPQAAALVLLSAVLVAGPIGNAVAQPVPFADPNLEFAVRSALAKLNGSLTVKDLSGLVCLSAASRQITNLSGLQYAANLEALQLNDNDIKNLEPLQSLSRLRSIQLENNQISDLSPLASLTSLTCLSLSGTYVGDYLPLSSLKALSSLSIRGGHLGDLGFIEPLTALTNLTLWQGGINNLTPLARLTNLARLDLRWNFITDCSPLLAGPTNLTSLHLGGNLLSNVPSLNGLRQLKLLNLDENHIHDLNPLASLTNVTYLALSRNPITNYEPLASLTALENLEVRGNLISNGQFLSSLVGLRFADLAYNNITNLSPLLGLTNLNSLVLAGNPLANHSAVAGMATVTNLWLFNNGLSNANFVASLSAVNHLNLEGNRLTNVPNLLSLPKLTGLGLSRNPISNYSPLSGLTNLTGLRLDDSGLGDIRFLTNLSQLAFLSLNQNHITDLSPVTWFTNLKHLYLRRNSLRDLEPLTSNLPALLNVDLSLNLLSLAPGSPALTVIQGLQSHTTSVSSCACILSSGALESLQCQRVQVLYLPTNQPPTISAPPRWHSSCEATSSLAVAVWEDPPPGDARLVVTATSSNTNLVQVVTNPLAGADYIRTLTYGSTCNPLTNSATITLTVTDDVGLSATGAVEVVVWPHILLSSQCPNTDPALLSAISVSCGKPLEELYIADALDLTSLSVDHAEVQDSCVWDWLTNLTYLELGGSAVSNLNFVGKLRLLEYLRLGNTSVKDLSPLTALERLRSLLLESNPITNYVVVLPLLTNLDTLWLIGSGLSDACFLESMRGLTHLEFSDARLTDISCLSGLTNLAYVHLHQNLLTDIGSLTNLPQLSLVDVTYNYLDTQDGSAAMAAVRALTESGVHVVYSPQHIDGQFFGMTNILWLTGGDSSWFGQTNVSLDGVPAVQSGRISDLQTSWLEAFVNGPGTLTFWWRTSSQTNKDWLEFEFLGKLKRLSGETDWQEVSTILPPGRQNLIWRYWRDDSGSRGADAAWIAHVSFVPGSWVELAGEPMKDQRELICYCVPGAYYGLQTSPDVLTWQPLEPELFLCTNSVMSLPDPNPFGSARFFRLKAAVGDPPSLTFTWASPSELVLFWDNPLFILQSAPTVSGPWRDLGGTSPFWASPELSMRQFFRLRSASQ